MVFLFVATLLYFLPSIVGRNKADFTGILLLNLLLGWTVVGWFVALIWASASRYEVPARYVPVGHVPTSSGRFCSQCGTLGPAAARYCGACGHVF